MTISSTTRIAGPFLSGTALPYTFKVFAAADLNVVRLNTSTGVETSLVLGSDYTVALNGNQNTNPGGTVNLTVAASATSTVTITSDIANLQPTDLTNQGGFYPEVITDSLDRATIQIQQMSEDVGRSLKGPISDGNLNMELPTAAVRASKYLVFDANGLPIPSAGSGTDSALRTDLANTGVTTAGAGLVGFRTADATSVGRTVLSKLRDVVSVKDFGNDIATAVSAIGATVSELVIDAPVTVAANLTIPTTLSVRVIRGGGITIDNGITLTVNGLFDAPIASVFTLVGTGSVVFGTSAIEAAFPQWWGAIGDGTTNCTTSIQAAMDAYKVVQLIPGTYATTAALQFKGDGIQINGSGMGGATTISRSGSGSVFENSAKATVTRLFCGIANMRIISSAAGANAVVDWRSMQFGRITNVWITGQSTAGCSCIRMDVATFGVTEATYNIVSGCYFGLCAYSIYIGDGGNSNLIIGNRMQTSFAGGYGVFLEGTTAGAVSNNSIISNGFEYPGAINTGILVSQNTDGTLISGNRFESLSNGISVGATSNKNVNAAFSANYFSGCTNNINLASTPTASGNTYSIRASASISGTGAVGPLVFNDVQFNMGGSKTATGTYAVTFVDGNLPSTGYVINATTDQPNVVVSAKSASGFTLETRNSSYVLTDATRLDVVVMHNR
jgi:hypothetical protein